MITISPKGMNKPIMAIPCGHYKQTIYSHEIVEFVMDKICIPFKKTRFKTNKDV